MRSVSSTFEQALLNDTRSFTGKATVVLKDNTTLELTSAEIWQGGISFDDNVSDLNSFTALGSVVINSATVIINNIYDDYSSYDFKDALITIYTGLKLGTSEEYVKMGTMIVENPVYNGSLITLECLDYMSKFNKPYSNSSLVYPATLGTIVSTACYDCGVTLQTTTFPNSTLQIATKPVSDTLTYREVISYAATLAGCFARCNSSGALELKWFSSYYPTEQGADGGIFDSSTPYSSGDTADGGTFNPWTTGSVINGGLFINGRLVHRLASQNIETDNVTITGVQIEVITTNNAESTTVSHLYGTDDYTIKIEDNPFITESNVNTVGNFLNTQLSGTSFRPGSVSHLSDPVIEAGDIVYVRDRKRNVYTFFVTNTNFKIGSYQQTVCAAESAPKNKSIVYSVDQKTYTAVKTLVSQEKTARENLGNSLTQAINAKAGMYETRVQEQGGGYTYYLHDKSTLAQSSAVLKITNEAVAVTPNYQASPPTWYGLTVNGNYVANIMSTIGIDFDWGTGGTLTLGGANNVNGLLVMKDANNDTIGTWNNTGITLYKGIISSADWDYDYDTLPIYSTAGMRISLNDKYIRTPNFAVVNGNLYARNGTFSGSVTATSGEIGAWGINDYQISYYDAITEGTASTQYGVFVRAKEDSTHAADADTYHFCVYHRAYTGSSYGNWVVDWGVKHDGSFTATKGTLSSIAINNGAFSVTPAGVMSATGGTFSGAITATSGSIGGFTVSSTSNTGTTASGGHVYTNSLYTHSSGAETVGTVTTNYEYEAGLAGGGAYNNAAFYIKRMVAGGSWSSSDHVFYVRNDGYMYSTRGNIAGWSISDSALSRGGGYNSPTANSMYFGNSGLSVKDKFRVDSDGNAYCVGGALHIADRNAGDMGEIIFSTGTVGASSDGIVLNTTLGGIWMRGGKVALFGGDNGVAIGLKIGSTDTTGITLSKTVRNTVECSISGELYLNGTTEIIGDTRVTGALLTTSTVTTGGNINIVSTASAAYAVGVQNAVKKVQLYIASNGNMGVYNATDSHYVIYEDADNVIRMPQVYAKTNSGAANIYIDSYGRTYRSTASSKRYKKDIKPLEDYKKVLDIPVVSFIYRKGYLSEDDQRYGVSVPGLIAEDVEEIYPVATEKPEGRIEDWNIRYIVPPMLAVEQDHEKRINELESELKELKALIKKLVN